MIYFACTSCGQPLVREDHAAGTIILCSCGHTTQVPTAAGIPWATPVPPLEVVPVPQPEQPSLAEPAADAPFPEPPTPTGNPCLNHPEKEREHTCEACQEGFCTACVVRFQDELLCGACKNFRLRVLQRPSQVSGLAVASLVITLGMGGCGHCLLFAGAGSQQPGMAVLGIVPQIIALILGIMAVREVETKPRTTGRALAMTGLLTAVVVCLELVLLGLVVLRQLQ